MARGRMISKSLSTSRKFAELANIAGPLAEFCQLLFPLLVSHADDYGRLSGDAFTVKFQVFPISPRQVDDFETAIGYIAKAGLIDVYESNGDKFIQVSKFDEHQTGLHKRAASSKFPELPGTSGNPPEIPGQLKRIELNRTEQKGTEPNRTEGKGTHGRTEKVQAFMDYYREKHSQVFGVAYMGSNSDYTKACELVDTFSDQQLRDATLVWFGMDDDFAKSGTRTVPKFASRITACLQRMKERGIA
jgi:hypothetical protein